MLCSTCLYAKLNSLAFALLRHPLARLFADPSLSKLENFHYTLHS